MTNKPSSTRTALLVVYAGYIARYLSLIVLIPYFGRVLGATEYGKVLTGMSVMGIIWAVVNWGFSPVGIRNVAGVVDKKALAVELGRQTHGRLLLMWVGLVVGGIATFASPVLREEPMFGVLGTILGILLGSNLGWYFQGTKQYATSILLEVAGFLINLVLVLILVKSRADAVYAMVSLVSANVIVLASAYTIALRQLRGEHLPLSGAFQLITESTSLFMLSAVPMLTLTASSYLLSLFVTATDIGHFGSAERLATAALGLLGPANQVMLSVVASHLKSGVHESESYALMRKGIFGLSGFGLIATVGTVIVAPWLIPLIFGPGFEPSIRILQVLSLSFPFNAFLQALSVYVLVPLKKETAAVRVTLIGSAIQVTALVVLARPFGGDGAAAARAFTDFASASLLFFVLWRIGVMQRVLWPYGHPKEASQS